MSLNDEIEKVECLLDRIQEGFLEMRTALQDCQKLTTSLTVMHSRCDGQTNSLMQSMVENDEFWDTESRQRILDTLYERLQDLQRLDEMPHWVFEQWPVLIAGIRSLDASPGISAERCQIIQHHMDKQQQLIRDEVKEIYRLSATIRYQTKETIEMLEQPTEEELRTEELVKSAR
ncbi:hypothetical protein PspLS_01838 [Pyricularia sp. CBS 133598]|nr:hypothetical protein PspLS_01838 [Pyricularia sp. CBS 133598]